MDLGDIPEMAALDVGGDEAVSLVGVSLVAHLRGELVFIDSLCKLARFPDGAGKWLLGEDVLPCVECPHRGGVVGVVGRADHYGIEIPGLLLEHLIF